MRRLTLFSNDIGTSLAANPYFMHLLCIDIPSRAGADSLPLGIGLVRIGVGYRAVENKMSGFAAVLVRWVVSIAARWSARRGGVDVEDSNLNSRAICPCEDMTKPPRTNLALCFFP
jgi:hypothetical protein